PEVLKSMIAEGLVPIQFPAAPFMHKANNPLWTTPIKMTSATTLASKSKKSPVAVAVRPVPRTCSKSVGGPGSRTVVVPSFSILARSELALVASGCDSAGYIKIIRHPHSVHGGSYHHRVNYSGRDSDRGVAASRNSAAAGGSAGADRRLCYGT